MENQILNLDPQAFNAALAELQLGAEREAGASPSSDQRSFMMLPTINQRVDQQMIDEVSAYLENLQRTGMR